MFRLTLKMPTARLVLALLFSAFALALPQPAAAGTETILHAFTGQPDGAEPYSSLTPDAAGNLYGITIQGGTYNYGTVFQLTPPASSGATWGYQVIYSFTGGNDGAYPFTDLLYDNRSGGFFGATNQGGGTACGCGVVFKLVPPTVRGAAWQQKTLYHFQGGTDGAYPGWGNMLRDASGSLYMTTEYGGSFTDGTVLKLTSGPGGNWIETVLFTFNYGPVGVPFNGLVFDSSANILGPSASGPFKLVAPTPQYPYWNDMLLGSNYPTYGGLVIDKFNVVYAARPGASSFGEVLSFAPAGGGSYNSTVLYSFNGGADGSTPLSGLTRDAAKNVLYGTTAYGGPGCASSTNGCGVVYKLARTGAGWSYSVIYSFMGGEDGWLPQYPRLFRDSANNLYGVTTNGGSSALNNGVGYGTVYMIAQ